MKEDLGMHGNELVTAVTIWTVGYVIGQIPVNLLLTRVPPRYVLCGVSLEW
jgi:ACS family pantothenate transporter-like MFS transporter